MWFTDLAHGMLRLFIAEERDAVHVLVLDNAWPPDPHEDTAYVGFTGPTTLQGKLAEPLGQRSVIDASTGEAVEFQHPPTDADDEQPDLRFDLRTQRIIISDVAERPFWDVAARGGVAVDVR